MSTHDTMQPNMTTASLATTRLELDPNGDVEIILAKPNTQGWTWPTRAGATSGQQSISRPAKKQRTKETEAGKEEDTELRILVSSRHLCLASCVLEEMLTGPWKEGSIQMANSGGRLVNYIRTSDWDAQAFRIVLDIIHGHNDKVPPTVSLKQLTKIATLVDYYNCHEAVRVFANKWAWKLEKNVPEVYEEKLVLWMVVRWVFLHPEKLRELAFIAIKTMNGPFETMGLPLSQQLVEFIESMRARGLDSITKVFDDLYTPLLNKDRFCKTECTHSDMTLGALTRLKHEAGLSASGDDKRPCSLRQIEQEIHRLGSLAKGSDDEPKRPRKKSTTPKPCNHNGLGEVILTRLSDHVSNMQSISMSHVVARRLQVSTSAKQEASAKREQWGKSLK